MFSVVVYCQNNNTLKENDYDDCIRRAIYSFAHTAIKRPNNYSVLKSVIGDLE